MKKQTKLSEIGEKALVQQITESLTAPGILVDGYGNDAAFINCPLGEDQLLTVNTDRSGLNLAYQLGLGGPECVGDLGVSHAISDIIAAGAEPIAVTIALLLPPDTEVGFVKGVMKGAEQAAGRYGAIVAGGDTKQNPKFAMVVTAFGKVNRNERLRRDSAECGDSLVVTGHLGTMLLGSKVFRDRNHSLPEEVYMLLKNALVHQNPPHILGRAISSAKLANACMDISDGLASALYSVCGASNLGATIDESSIPVHPELVSLAKEYDLRNFQLSLAGGDWQYLYAIPPENISAAKAIAESVGHNFQVIGRMLPPGLMTIKSMEGEYRELNRIEHDSFGDGLKGQGYFEKLSSPLDCFGEAITADVISAFSAEI